MLIRFCFSMLSFKSLLTKEEKSNTESEIVKLYFIWKMIQFKWLSHVPEIVAYHKVCKFECVCLILLILGTIIRRHRIPKPAPNEHLFYNVHDFNIGIEIEFYGKILRIISCDEFTHNFLRKLGVHVIFIIILRFKKYMNFICNIKKIYFLTSANSSLLLTS